MSDVNPATQPTDAPGAKAEAKEVKPLVEDAKGDNVIEVVTTAPGVLNNGGVIPVGTIMTIDKKRFSKNWMRKATTHDRDPAAAAAVPDLGALEYHELKLMMLSMGVKPTKVMKRSDVIKMIRKKLTEFEITPG